MKRSAPALVAGRSANVAGMKRPRQTIRPQPTVALRLGRLLRGGQGARPPKAGSFFSAACFIANDFDGVLKVLPDVY
jgi:hypothetical protein